MTTDYSTARIDHATEARDLLEPSGMVPNLHAIPAERIAIAQVHATLALVEQQRIANLIALVDMRPEIRDQGFALDALRVGVAGEVWEGLGLA